ncbi:hypothetical protein TI39_contig411g00023 [Zymoseptoria brevis]|uniref:Ankyrin repeat protein n=1 Tax=Zymoseptoria brevis TaxID=1047168 RepID=A0A0F4GM17_9PEZI|nr:hypothetical protein TI39_contig411g00023 [Zymoseptoria brevis]
MIYHNCPVTLQAAQNGDLQILKRELSTFALPDITAGKPPPLAKFIHSLPYRYICAAADSGQHECVRWLIHDKFPDFIPDFDAHWSALDGGVGVCSVFWNKWPGLPWQRMGSQGNPMGFAVLGSSWDLVVELLERGVDPNEAEDRYQRWSAIQLNRSVRTFEKWFDDVEDEILELIFDHGYRIPYGAKRHGQDALASLVRARRERMRHRTALETSSSSSYESSDSSDSQTTEVWVLDAQLGEMALVKAESGTKSEHGIKSEPEMKSEHGIKSEPEMKSEHGTNSKPRESSIEGTVLPDLRASTLKVETAEVLDGNESAPEESDSILSASESSDDGDSDYKPSDKSDSTMEQSDDENEDEATGDAGDDEDYQKQDPARNEGSMEDGGSLDEESKDNQETPTGNRSPAPRPRESQCGVPMTKASSSEGPSGAKLDGSDRSQSPRNRVPKGEDGWSPRQTSPRLEEEAVFWTKRSVGG